MCLWENKAAVVCILISSCLEFSEALKPVISYDENKFIYAAQHFFSEIRTIVFLSTDTVIELHSKVTLHCDF